MTPNHPILRSKWRLFRRNSDLFLNYLALSSHLDTHIQISIKNQRNALLAAICELHFLMKIVKSKKPETRGFGWSFNGMRKV